MPILKPECHANAQLNLNVNYPACIISAGVMSGRVGWKKEGRGLQERAELEVRWALSVELSHQLVRWHQSLPGVSSGQSAQEKHCTLCHTHRHARIHRRVLPQSRSDAHTQLRNHEALKNNFIMLRFIKIG